jgi:ATF/CREB family transcription factor
LKCRQRKKQWLANLQQKVELFSTENDSLSATVTQTLLLAHKDCPVAQAQGLSGLAMNQFLGELSHHVNPYGIGMGAPNGVQMGMPMPPGPHVQNRYDSLVSAVPSGYPRS